MHVAEQVHVCFGKVTAMLHGASKRVAPAKCTSEWRSGLRGRKDLDI